MNFNSIRYLFTEGLKNLLNNIFMALASLGVLTACLLIVGFSVLLKQNMNNIGAFMGQQSVVMIYFKDSAPQEKIDELTNCYKENADVKSVEFTSKEQALKNFSKKIKNEIALKILSENNSLPRSIALHVKNIEKIDSLIKISQDAKFSEHIERINSPTKFTETIREFNKTTRVFGTILIIALISASLIIISNTIRATVFARRREIAIMKQVGATDGFVRFPFLVEGATIGAIAAIIAFFLTWILYKTITSVLTKSSSEFLNLMFSNLVNFKDVSFLMATSFLLCGILTGALGSVISLRRYLKI